MSRLLLHVSVWFAFGTAILQTAEGTQTFDCELHYLSWLYPESLTVNWTLPEAINKQDVEASISWNTSHNEGSCWEKSLTTCMWPHGYNGVNFHMPFSLNIIIRDRSSSNQVWNTRFDIDPLVSCIKPPVVDLFTVSSVNSTCVDVRWEYTNLTDCSVLDTKLYRITYRIGDTVGNTTKQSDYFETSTISCEGRQYVYGLHPYTAYIFTIKAKSIDYSNTSHFSDETIQIMKTPEEAPGVAPGLNEGAWSYEKQECTSKNSRQLRLFWKDVPDAMKYGELTNFIVTVNDHNGVTDFSFPGNQFTGIVTLKCDKTYMISMTAVNKAGISPRSDTITIALYASRQSNSIERVIPEVSENMYHVFWYPRDVEKKYTVLWCLKHTEHHCQSSVNWTIASNDADFTSIPGQADRLPHEYAIAVATAEDGAVWADCLYSPTEISAPKNVVVKGDVSLLDGSIVVSWYNVPCGKVVPYIHVYHIYMCQVESMDKTDCLDSMSITVLDGKRDKIVFHNLEPGKMYKVQMKAIGLHNRTSSLSKIALGRATLDDNTIPTGRIVLIIIGGLVLLVLAVYGVYRIKKKLCDKWNYVKKNIGGVKIPEYSGVCSENTF